MAHDTERLRHQRSVRIGGRTDERRLPRRAELSQHFLRDPALARALVEGMRLARGSLVLEIGPGRGMITAALADAGFRVIAVEKDVRLYRSLRARFMGRTNVECHHGDALEYEAPREPHVVVSNVPYNITAALVRRTVESRATDAFLIVQREAAEKFAGVPAESLFSLLHKPSFELTIGRAFTRTDFEPAPAVESVLLRIQRRDVPLLDARERAGYRAFVLASFGTRRQRARDALRLRFTEPQIVRLMHELRIARDARPSEISFPQWLALFRFQARTRCDAWPRGRTPRAPAAGGCGVRGSTNETAVRAVSRGRWVRGLGQATGVLSA
jgi:23S rRNA (adenine-N6)-dimethyltransferase